MTYLIEYLGEFEFIIETVLGYVSGDQMGSFEAKKRSRKSHAWAPLSLTTPNPQSTELHQPMDWLVISPKLTYP